MYAIIFRVRGFTSMYTTTTYGRGMERIEEKGGGGGRRWKRRRSRPAETQKVAAATKLSQSRVCFENWIKGSSDVRRKLYFRWVPEIKIKVFLSPPPQKKITSLMANFINIGVRSKNTDAGGIESLQISFLPCFHLSMARMHSSM